MRTSSKLARLLSFGVLACSLASGALADPTYPNKLIRMVVPYPAGGAVGNLAHLVGQKLKDTWGQPVVVDYRPGGGTIIGADAVAKSAPDGYTLFMTASTHVTLPLLYDKVPFDPIQSFAPVTTLANGEQLLLINTAVPAQNLREFIALAKSKPGQLNYASSGAGSPTNLAGELFKMMSGTDIRHVPYKGAAPAITDLVGGHLEASFQNLAVALPHVQSGKVRALAISGAARSPALPQVPTFGEGGLSNFDAQFWFGVLAPAGTPKDVTAKLSAELGKVMAMADIKQTLVVQGLNPYVMSPEEFGALLQSDRARYERVIKSANIKLKN